MIGDISMKVGFIGFGEVATTISKGLRDKAVEIYTSLEGRTPRTCSLAEKTGVNICEDQIEVAKNSDILISTVTPSQAVEVARAVGKYSKGVYADINNVSPKTVEEALSYIENGKTVDAAIMGSIKRLGFNVPIIVSGSSAIQFMKLNKYGMNIKVIGPEIGQASTLKMLRSSYTKSVSALLFESLYSAYKLGLDEELLKSLEETECPGFRESAISRITSSAFHAERRAQELYEILDMISEYSDPMISKATAEFFNMLTKKLGKLEKTPEDYKNIFERIQK
jgi:3-hydroxyisobutyrate dehydrogenase-like beta-hydroxyacid dehydrogenase